MKFIEKHFQLVYWLLTSQRWIRKRLGGTWYLNINEVGINGLTIFVWERDKDYGYNGYKHQTEKYPECAACEEQMKNEQIEHFYHRMIIRNEKMRAESFRLGNRSSEIHFLKQRDLFIRKKNDLINTIINTREIPHTCKPKTD